MLGIKATRRGQRWNHNTHYHRLILAAVPPGCQRVLDAGCGEGMLARRLASIVPHVVGIDLDAASIDLARRQDPDGQIEFIRGDFLTQPFPAAPFQMISSVAALHHMNARRALSRMDELLAPGGTLAIVGLARSRLPADLPWEAAAVVANLGYKVSKTYWEQPSPTVWPPPHTYTEIHALAQQALPGVQYRRHLLWRYSLVWAKPTRTSMPDHASMAKQQRQHTRPD
jgi:SAM-dependent methyltransferase